MLTIRKWLYKPKKTDNQLLAQFFYADEELNTVSQELDSFDGRQDPERCTLLVNQLRLCQDKVLIIIEQMMNIAIPDSRASRDFRAKFPDDVLQDSLAGQLWFGAECLAAGSTIMNREIESAALRPLARCLTRSLDCLRAVLREQTYRNLNSYPQKVKEALKKFDTMFAEFELSYVSAMVPVKSAHEYDTMQDVIILFCETINRALFKKLLTQDQIDDYDPGLMFTIPRLAIVSGLVTFTEGPLNMNRPPSQISELFRPFQNLLIKIKELLETLADKEIYLLERALCSSEESWEDIERQLNQLSFRDRPMTSLESHVHDDIACGLSPCSSCLTDCDTACSSLVSLTPDDGRAFLHASVRRKSSDASNRSSADDLNHIDIPGAVNGDRVSGEMRVVRMRKCSRTSRSSGTPQLSPDSLDGFASGSTENVNRQRNSSQRGELGLEDSGLFPDASLASLNMDLSPRLVGVHDERTITGQRGDDERGSMDCPCEHSMQRTPAVHIATCPHTTNPNAQNQARVLRREDSGLGSAPNGDLLELYIQDMESYDPDPDVPIASPNGETVEKSKQPADEPVKDDTSIIVEMQQSELIVPTTSKDSHSLKHANSNTPKITMDFSSNFPMFGKGKPSTELNTTRTVGNSVHRFSPSLIDSDSSSRETLVTSRQSYSSLSLDQTHQIETSAPHPIVRSSHSEPSFRLPFRGSHVHGNNAREHLSSALNRVTGSRGIVRQPAMSGSDGEDLSDLSSSASSSSSSSCCSCCSSGPKHDDDDRDTDYKWESDDSSDTNSLMSENNDEQEITMAIQAAELAARQQVRSQFRSSSDLVHRLFVCIAGVADQLQTNFASDLRSILKTVFEVTACNPMSTDDSVFTNSPTTSHPETKTATTTSTPATHEQASSSSHPTGSSRPAEGSSAAVHGEGRDRHRHRSNSSHRSRRSANYDDPPVWMPDEDSDECMACHSSFTVIRRKHHCRNCGQIFCARCSANSVPLPRYGQMKPVRVCNRCYVFHVTPFQH